MPVFGQEWDLSAATKVMWGQPSFTGYPLPSDVPLKCGPKGVTLAAPERFGGHAPRVLYGRLWFLDTGSGKRFHVTGPRGCGRAAEAVRG